MALMVSLWVSSRGPSVTAESVKMMMLLAKDRNSLPAMLAVGASAVGVRWLH